MSPAEMEALRALYAGVDPAAAATLRRQLVDVGDGLAAQFADLERDFTPERAERLLHNLSGAMAQVRRLVALEAAA